MLTLAEYLKAKKVKIIFIKKWIGWYNVINNIGKIKYCKKYKNRYYECDGHGYPIFDITDYVKEVNE